MIAMPALIFTVALASAAVLLLDFLRLAARRRLARTGFSPPSRILADREPLQYDAVRRWLRVAAIVEMSLWIAFLYWFVLLLGPWMACLPAGGVIVVRILAWYQGMWLGENKLDDGSFHPRMNGVAKQDQDGR
jgi:hypothetical protein